MTVKPFEHGFAGVDSAKLDNRREAMPTKVSLRQTLFEKMMEHGAVNVFDAFAGTGALHKAVWHKADHYVGCDLAFEPLRGDPRKMFSADNRRVLRAIDLSAFNVFDLDAYGSPWEQALIIAARRQLEPGEHIGFVFTDGSGRTLKANRVPKGMRHLAEISPTLSGVWRWHDELIGRCLDGMGQRMGAKVVRRWQAKGRTGLVVFYVAAIFAASAPGKK